jgi:hypothetical protein
MAIQLSVGIRNARLDAIETTGGTSCSLRIKTGSPPANCATAESGTTLVTINLPSDWMAAASSGSKAKNGTWQDTSADGAGTAGHFRVYNSQATLDETTCIMQGTVSGSGGGGDMELDNAVIASGQTVTINTFTLTDANP